MGSHKCTHVESISHEKMVGQKRRIIKELEGIYGHLVSITSSLETEEIVHRPAMADDLFIPNYSYMARRWVFGYVSENAGLYVHVCLRVSSYTVGYACSCLWVV